MSKNIETCKSEEVLASVTEQQPQDYPSVQQAVHDLGVTALPAASAADPDIAELPSNVEVFVSRVLKAIVYDRVLPVVQQMWQAVLNRCSDYLPASLRPYAQDPSLRTLGTLPTAISALSVRKISNGSATNDGIKDGVSLVHLLCDNAATKLVDDNYGWAYTVANKAGSLFGLFPSADDVTFGFGSCTADFLTSSANATKLRFPTLKTISCVNFIGTSGNPGYPSASWATTHLYFDSLESATNLVRYYGNGWWNEGMMNLQYIYLPKLKRIYSTGTAALFQGKCPSLIKLEMPELETMDLPLYGGDTLAGLTELRMPKLKYMNVALCSGSYPSANSLTNLQLLEVGPVQTNMDIRYWNPTDKGTAFLENFLHHIAERLAVGPTTNRLTLTLSADVYSACGFGATIDDQTDIRYQIKKAIQDRNWKVTDGTNNFNQ